MELDRFIRSVPDYPIEGIVFKDITTLLKEPKAFKSALDDLYLMAKDKGIDKVVGIESRGFIFGGALADRLGAGFVPIRKPGKLPHEKFSEDYTLEYGTDSIEIHSDAIEAGDKILLHDDLLATGGTMEAAAKLMKKFKAEVVQISFLIELTFLNGREKLKDFDVQSLVQYNKEA